MEEMMDSQASASFPNPMLFSTSPHFSDLVQRNLIASEIEGGVDLNQLAPGSVLMIQTQNRLYKMVVLADGAAMLSGHPEFCLEPTKVRIQGSTWGGSMLKARYLGRGMHLEFEHPLHRRIITSRILDIREY